MLGSHASVMHSNFISTVYIFCQFGLESWAHSC